MTLLLLLLLLLLLTINDEDAEHSLAAERRLSGCRRRMHCHPNMCLIRQTENDPCACFGILETSLE